MPAGKQLAPKRGGQADTGTGRGRPGQLMLERAGFVARKRDERDRRRYALELTPAGRRALQRRDEEAVRLNEELFAPLRPEEREQLRRLLLRALAHHDPRVPAPGPDDGCA